MSAVSKVLVIDDDLAVRLRVRDVLAPSGDFTIEEAPDGTAGIKAAIAAHPDLILLDLMMPGLSGLEVCARLRAHPDLREVPIIMLSAADDPAAMIAALETGADDFLRKPVSAPELRAKVRTITRLNRFRSLAGERDRFRWLLDHSLEPLIVADARGAVVQANDRARELFQLAASDGADIATAVQAQFLAEPADAWAAWREGRLPAGEGFVIFQPDTEQMAARWYEVELHALDASASQTLLKFTNRSGTVRRELETFTFQHLIAHKIRTPLNGLAPIFNFLASSGVAGLDEENTSLLNVARESAERLEETLLGVLNYHSAVFQPRRAESSAPRQPLAAVLALASAAVTWAGRVAFNGPVGTIAHAETLEVVFTEVFENYVKFSETPLQEIQATLVRAPHCWDLSCFAPGPGLPPDVVAQLGRPYAQLERKFSGEIPGVGLGLATVRLLMRSLGGDLVFSNHPTQSGIVSTIRLPLPAFSPGSSHDADLRTL